MQLGSIRGGVGGAQLAGVGILQDRRKDSLISLGTKLKSEWSAEDTCETKHPAEKHRTHSTARLKPLRLPSTHSLRFSQSEVGVFVLHDFGPRKVCLWNYLGPMTAHPP